MELKEVKEIVANTPNMTLEEARSLERLLPDSGSLRVLELGIGHGVSTCYLAAAVGSRGGQLTSVDLESARRRSPNVYELLKLCGLEPVVTVHLEPTSYTWRLMRLLQEDPSPRFDLCYLDAAHSWFVDGFGFFLVDRLLKPGGWLVLDDLRWAFSSSSIRDTDYVRAMPMDERDANQVELVYELLVKPHPNYGDFRTCGNWALARKMQSEATSRVSTRYEIVLERPDQTLRRIARHLLGLRRRGPS